MFVYRWRVRDLMRHIESNSELLESIPFFGDKENLISAGKLFDFDKRHIVFGNGAIEYVGKE